MKVAANIFSYVFHPLFIPTLLMAFLLGFSPELFYGLNTKQQHMELITVAYTTITFPLLTSFLLWRLGFIESMKMKDTKERYVPLISCMLFYFWVFWLFHKQFKAHAGLQVFLLAIFLSCVLSFLINLFSKISLHSASFGLVTAFAIYLLWQGISGASTLVIIAIFLSGFVASSRLYLKEHSNKQVYAGFVVGLLSILLSIPVIKLLT